MDILDIITKVGFPIAMVLWFLLRTEEKLDAMTASNVQVNESLIRLNQIIEDRLLVVARAADEPVKKRTRTPVSGIPVVKAGVKNE